MVSNSHNDRLLPPMSTVLSSRYQCTLLYNAPLALSARHMDSTNSAYFKLAAMQELGKSFATADMTNDSEIMASSATISLIIFYNTVQSALGPRRVHLSGARRLIPACGGLERIKKVENISRILRVLIWYVVCPLKSD